MKVLKFGGTSVGTAKSLQNVKSIIESSNETMIVVVSALGGITDKLIKTSHLAASGAMSYMEEYNMIVERHHLLIDELFEESERKRFLFKEIDCLFDELEKIFQGLYLIKDLSSKTSDLVVSYGERLSSLIISKLIKDAELKDARSFIKTFNQYDKHFLDKELTHQLICQTFSKLPRICIVPGFIATDNKSGEITNLGRGGSDYTASLIAASLEATILEIWTDVNGFMTADPKVISSAYTIPELSYGEAMELCNFGAKVVYPPTIYPVCQKHIPILIKNTFSPETQGTMIKEHIKLDPKHAIKGISSIKDTCLITVQGLGMVGVIGVNRRIFRAFAKRNISVFMVAQASSENSTSIGVKSEDVESAREILNKEFEAEIQAGEMNETHVLRNLSTVAIVGDGMRHTTGIAGKLFGTIGRNGINIIACAQGASEKNISFVIDKEHLKKALNVIHDSFFLSEYQVLNVFICGIGTVGSKLIEQIKSQQDNLKEKKGLNINVVGIANSKRVVFNREGIDLTNYEEQLKSEGVKNSPTFFRDEILRLNIFNSVFVDCTASSEVSSIYKSLLDRSVSVVAANKIAASSSYDEYKELKHIAEKRGVKFLYEANVGAGLPVINTIDNLINSGDKIYKIEAVLSGTLNYIFNNLSKDIPFSKTIKMAQDAQYAEPDPRIDLSGTDVVRKLVILVREAGYRLEQEEVEKTLFLPSNFFDGTLEEFWEQLPSLNDQFEKNRQEIEGRNGRLRFVACFDHGKASVGLQEVDSSHPFYNLEGSNNILLFTTERYKDYPLLIQGYGAGAGVTAGGIFSDIISIANIR